jgi:hypothetical protein
MVNYPDGCAFDDDLANYIVVGGTAKYPTAKELYYAESWFMRDRKAVLFLDDGIDIVLLDGLAAVGKGGRRHRAVSRMSSASLAWSSQSVLVSEA